MEPTNDAAPSVEISSTATTQAPSNPRRKAWFALGTVLFGTINIISGAILYFIREFDISWSIFGEQSLLMVVIVVSGIAMVYRGGISLVVAAGLFAYMWVQYLEPWMFG